MSVSNQELNAKIEKIKNHMKDFFGDTPKDMNVSKPYPNLIKTISQIPVGVLGHKTYTMDGDPNKSSDNTTLFNVPSKCSSMIINIVTPSECPYTDNQELKYYTNRDDPTEGTSDYGRNDQNIPRAGYQAGNHLRLILFFGEDYKFLNEQEKNNNKIYTYRNISDVSIQIYRRVLFQNTYRLEGIAGNRNQNVNGYDDSLFFKYKFLEYIITIKDRVANRGLGAFFTTLKIYQYPYSPNWFLDTSSLLHQWKDSYNNPPYPRPSFYPNHFIPQFYVNSYFGRFDPMINIIKYDILDSNKEYTKYFYSSGSAGGSVTNFTTNMLGYPDTSINPTGLDSNGGSSSFGNGLPFIPFEAHNYLNISAGNSPVSPDTIRSYVNKQHNHGAGIGSNNLLGFASQEYFANDVPNNGRIDILFLR